MASSDVVCLSHVPWGFALERPHQLMRRFARDRHVFFVEPPVVAGDELRTVVRAVLPSVHVVALHVPSGTAESAVVDAHRRCVTAVQRDAWAPVLWVYAPSLVRSASELEPSLVVYDCVADHGARRTATTEERDGELDLLRRADLVFTAGTSLFEAKRAHNTSTYPLPSSVEAEHFEGTDAIGAGRRVGFLGPIDDRVDLGLLDELAAARPDLQLVLAGGLTGTTTWDLPDRPNVEWLGELDYAALPREVATWDLAIVPFHGDLATRRTESSGLLACVAAGKHVVTTPLDELASLAEQGLVTVAEAPGFVGAVELALREAKDPVLRAVRRRARQSVLARTSWDRTANAMMRLLEDRGGTSGRPMFSRRRAVRTAVLGRGVGPSHFGGSHRGFGR